MRGCLKRRDSPLRVLPECDSIGGDDIFLFPLDLLSGGDWGELAVVQLGVEDVARQQIRVVALLDDVSLAHGNLRAQ